MTRICSEKPTHNERDLQLDLQQWKNYHGQWEDLSSTYVPGETFSIPISKEANAPLIRLDGTIGSLGKNFEELKRIYQNYAMKLVHRQNAAREELNYWNLALKDVGYISEYQYEYTKKTLQQQYWNPEDITADVILINSTQKRFQMKWTNQMFFANSCLTQMIIATGLWSVSDVSLGAFTKTVGDLDSGDRKHLAAAMLGMFCLSFFVLPTNNNNAKDQPLKVNDANAVTKYSTPLRVGGVGVNPPVPNPAQQQLQQQQQQLLQHENEDDDNDLHQNFVKQEAR